MPEEIAQPQPAGMRFECVQASSQFGVGETWYSARLVSDGREGHGAGRVELAMMPSQPFAFGKHYRFIVTPATDVDDATTAEVLETVATDAVLDFGSPNVAEAVEALVAEEVAIVEAEKAVAAVVLETAAVQDSVPEPSSVGDTPADTPASPAPETPSAESLPAEPTPTASEPLATAPTEPAPAVDVIQPASSEAVAGSPVGDATAEVAVAATPAESAPDDGIASAVEVPVIAEAPAVEPAAEVKASEEPAAAAVEEVKSEDAA